MNYTNIFGSRLMEQNDYGYVGDGMFTQGVSTVSDEQAIRVATVFACNRVIAETLSSISLDVFRNVDNGREKANDLQLQTLLSLAPNERSTNAMWMEQIVFDLNMRGNHYAQIIRDGRGEVTGIYPLRADAMQVTLERGRVVYNYDNRYTKTSREILHIRGLTLGLGILGVSPIAHNMASIGLAYEAQSFGANFFKNGANPSGAFISDKVISDESFKRLRKSLDSEYAGSNKAGKIMLLEDGLKFQKMSLNPDEAQYLETRKFQKEEIASIFRVPMHLINSLENATFSNIEHQSLEFLKFTMLPWLNRIEQQLALSLLTREQREIYSIKFDFNTLLRGDYKTRTEGYRNMHMIGAISQNEIRRLENMNGIGDEGDRYFTQLNMREGETDEQ